MKNKLLNNKFLTRIMWIAIIAGAWQCISWAGIFSPLIFPSVKTIIKALFSAFEKGEIVKETAFSLLLIGKGLFAGIVLASVISVLSLASKTFNSLMETLTAIAHPLPGIALLPLIILWLGTGENSIVFIIVHSVLWPLVLNISAGFKSVPQIYRDVGKNMGLNSFQMITGIMIPGSWPYIISGIKIGWARSWRALISAEMIFGAVGGKGGLGWYIFKQRVFMDTPGMFAGLLVIVILGILVEDLVFGLIEGKTIKKWSKA